MLVLKALFSRILLLPVFAESEATARPGRCTAESRNNRSTSSEAVQGQPRGRLCTSPRATVVMTRVLVRTSPLPVVWVVERLICQVAFELLRDFYVCWGGLSQIA